MFPGASEKITSLVLAASWAPPGYCDPTVSLKRGESQHSHPGKISEGFTKHSEKTDTFLTLKLDTFLTLITEWKMLKAKIIKVTIFRYD